MVEYEYDEENREIDSGEEQDDALSAAKESNADGKIMISTRGGRKNKALTVKLLTSMLSKNSIELNLTDYELTDLQILDPVVSKMADVLFVDFSRN